MPRTPPPWLAAPAALAAAAVLALTAAPDPGGTAGPHGDLPAKAPDPPADAWARDLDAELREVKRRAAYKGELTGRLAAGRATLAEVTDEFVRLNRWTPAEGVIRSQFPGSSDEEGTDQNVLGYVRGLPLPPDREAEVLGRLGWGFAARFGRPPTEAR
jgi:hypothetical protein